ESTSFGSRKLLDGSFGTTAFQIGANAYETINLTMNSVAANKIGTEQATSSGITASGGVAVDTYTIQAGSASGTVASTAGMSAKDFAAAINKQGVPGVSASARTEATVAFAASGGASISLEIKVGDSKSVSITAATEDAFFAELNKHASTLNISVDS